ncbi:hypothetical protein BpHYR1_002186 [Brachionus plicatilis]|uniref:Uncharacterized protein n=1 Tax=Brachionus plicatilis TaxID=10195 RepID=A0A3M7Q982_BRAPC|nr:hypothetical protein BpHYR1_002186 [Brachionus plicatilis]
MSKVEFLIAWIRWENDEYRFRQYNSYKINIRQNIFFSSLKNVKINGYENLEQFDLNQLLFYFCNHKTDSYKIFNIHCFTIFLIDVHTQQKFVSDFKISQSLIFKLMHIAIILAQMSQSFSHVFEC